MGIMKCTQIKQLTFKVIQHPNADEEQVVQIAKCITHLRNLEKFDIYFRGGNWNQAYIKRSLSGIEDMNYEFCRKSLYLYKN